MNRILLCIVGLLIFSACNKKLASFNNKSDQLNLNNLEYDNISLKSKIRYKDENRELKAMVNIRIKKDSIIWFSITPGLGIEAARGVITQDSIIILDKIHKEYQILKVSELSEKYHFGFDLKFIESIIIGNLIWSVTNKDDIKERDGYFEIEKYEGDLSVKNFIGASSMKLEKMIASSDSSKNSLDIQYGDFLNIDDKIHPSEINMMINYRSKRNQSKKISRLQIRHARFDINKENLNFTFNIPAKYDPM